jgi:hypothetical protein
MSSDQVPNQASLKAGPYPLCHHHSFGFSSTLQQQYYQVPAVYPTSGGLESYQRIPGTTFPLPIGLLDTAPTAFLAAAKTHLKKSHSSERDKGRAPRPPPQAQAQAPSRFDPPIPACRHAHRGPERAAWCRGRIESRQVSLPSPLGSAMSSKPGNLPGQPPPSLLLRWRFEAPRHMLK